MVDCVQFDISNKARLLDKRYLETQARIDSLIRPIASYGKPLDQAKEGREMQVHRIYSHETGDPASPFLAPAFWLAGAESLRRECHYIVAFPVA